MIRTILTVATVAAILTMGGPVGLAFCASIVQLPSSAPASVYLNTRSVAPSSTTQKLVP